MEEKDARIEELTAKEEVPDNNCNKPETCIRNHSSHLMPSAHNRAESVETKAACQEEVDPNSGESEELQIEVGVRQCRRRIKDLHPGEEIDAERTKFIAE